MKKYKELKWLIIGALFLSVCGLVVAYISMSTALDIKEVNQFWKVEILNVKAEVKGKVMASGVEVISTSLNDFDINFDCRYSDLYQMIDRASLLTSDREKNTIKLELKNKKLININKLIILSFLLKSYSK